uniref:Vesicular, overexpressed in cancer, prosurvival protein 1 n=1 Tax=Ciona savignyi TaxID=51511 RepID=H2YNH2_CIOSA
MSNTLMIIVGSMLCVLHTPQGYEYCGDGYYCPDSGSQIRYCCGENIYGVPQCCSYTAYWGTWYFWLGIAVLFLLILLSTACCCKKRRARSAATCRHNPTLTTVSTEVHSQVNPAYMKPVADAPPSYQDLHGYPPTNYSAPTYPVPPYPMNQGESPYTQQNIPTAPQNPPVQFNP